MRQICSWGFVAGVALALMGAFGYATSLMAQGTQPPNGLSCEPQVNPGQCNTVGSSFCNAWDIDHPCTGSESCSYCSSTTTIPGKVCMNIGESNSSCGTGSVDCGSNNNTMQGTCAMQEGSGCICTNPKPQGQCGSNSKIPTC